MLHRLTEWEDNGYDDSDFWVSVFDDQTNEVVAVLSGSTRFAGYAPGKGPDLGTPISDLPILEKAIHVLAGHIFKSLRAAENKNVMEPVAVERGATVRLLRDCRHKDIVVSEGAAGPVFWSGTFGQFFHNGYNRPGRENTRLGITLSDGSSVYVALSACRLDREPEGDEALEARARQLAQYCGFSRMTGKKFAWDSENYALTLLERTRKKTEPKLTTAAA